MLLVVILIPLTGRQSNQFTTRLFRFNSIHPKHQFIRERQRQCLLINNVPAIITRPRPACSFHSLAHDHMLLSTLKLHRRICKGLSVFLPMLRSTQPTHPHSNLIKSLWLHMCIVIWLKFVFSCGLLMPLGQSWCSWVTQEALHIHRSEWMKEWNFSLPFLSNLHALSHKYAKSW